MSENMILISGIGCFSLTLIGLVLTFLEFRKMGQSESMNGESSKKQNETRGR